MATGSLEEAIGTCQMELSQQEMKRTSALKPPQEQPQKCPRCASLNTKFCYYNNYSLTQPRYFCKGCRRYWTKGGSLRNVPVGGGCRKSTKRSSSSKSRISNTNHLDQVLMITNNNSNPLLNSMILPSLTYESTNDPSLSFGGLHKNPTTRLLGFDDQDNNDTSILGHLSNTYYGNPNASISTNNGANNSGFLDALRSGFLDITQPAFNNVYYGLADGVNVGEGDNGVSIDFSGEDRVVLPYEDLSVARSTTSSMKEEFSSASENKFFLNFPWQFGGNHHQASNTNMGGNAGGGNDLSGRDSWINAITGSSWHGLVNSPLM